MRGGGYGRTGEGGWRCSHGAPRRASKGLADLARWPETSTREVDLALKDPTDLVQGSAHTHEVHAVDGAHGDEREAERAVMSTA